MTKIYSTNPGLVPNEKKKQDKASNSKLSAEDKLFFDAIKEALHKIEKEPSDKTIANILKYSKDL